MTKEILEQKELMERAIAVLRRLEINEELLQEAKQEDVLYCQRPLTQQIELLQKKYADLVAKLTESLCGSLIPTND